MKRDLVSFADWSAEDLREVLGLAARMKERGTRPAKPMTGKTAALIFEKQSLRTHVSFQVGVSQLGGDSVFLSQQHIGLSTRESVKDVAEVLSCYNDLIVARTMLHETVVDLARYASVPVINALTDLLHPCQILADALTLKERGLLNREAKIAFIGDGNNIVNSWLEFAEKIPIHFVLACPPGYEPDAAILAKARSTGVSRIDIVNNPLEAADGADVFYTDVWVSMGQESERDARRKAFARYQINEKLVRRAAKRCVIMHCLPAHRGEEITADVLEGSRSIVIPQAENRLHAQKAVMAILMGGKAALKSMIEEVERELVA